MYPVLKYLSGFCCWSIMKQKDNMKSMYTENHLLVILTKLWIGVPNNHLGHRFAVKTEIISKIYRNWLPLFKHFKELNHMIK